MNPRLVPDNVQGVYRAIWNDLMPALTEVRQRVAQAYGPIFEGVDGGRSNEYYPLRLMLTIVRPIDPEQHLELEEDVVVSIACHIPPNKESKYRSRFPKGLVSCYIDICDGTASFLIDGPMCTMSEEESCGPVPPHVAEWLEATKKFLRDQTDFMIQHLKELDTGKK